MSVRIMSMIFSADGLGGIEKLVLLSLADYANDEGKSIYPSVNRTALRTGLSERTVQRTIKSLVECELLLPVGSGGGRMMTNEYCISLSKLTEYVPQKGDTVTPFPDKKGCQRDTGGVSHSHRGGVSVTPDPLLTIINPPITVAAVAATPPTETNLNDGQRKFLGTFGAKRFKNQVQRETIARLWDAYQGNFIAALEWTAKRGMAMGQAIGAMEKVLPAWGNNGSKGNGGIPRAPAQSQTKYEKNVSVIEDWYAGKKGQSNNGNTGDDPRVIPGAYRSVPEERGKPDNR